MADLLSLNIKELNSAIEQMGEKKFRAKQLYDWLHNKLVWDYGEMNNLPKELRRKLSKEYPLPYIEEVQRLQSKLDGTNKFLFKLKDDNIIESVIMQYKHGNSVCISSQAGCRMGCYFCASALGGLVRNLEPSEMLLQVYNIQRITGKRVSHVVVMGTGEPFDNFDNLLKFMEILNSEQGLNISGRNVTVSTCGLVEGIRKFADRKLSATLAISLHAPTDDMRRRLMPVANRYSIEDILEACRYFIEKTGRRVTFEYSMVQGYNDSEEHAKMLSDLLKGMLCHVNLIPVNPIKERDYKQSEPERIERFRSILEKNHVNVTVRRTLGADINSSCGQLRRSYADR